MLLTICIPTYNRASMLETLLDSITRQSNDDNKDKVEIVICDNHSTDHTDEVVEKAKASGLFKITYIKHSTNTGLIKNVFSTVDNASGEYCWIMGSDDCILPGAIDRMIFHIGSNRNISVFIPQFKVLDFTLTRELASVQRPIYRFPDKFIVSPIEKYAKDVVYEIGYISVLIFKRLSWNSVEHVPAFEFNNYYHVYKIVRIAQKEQMMLIQEKLVGYRSNNDGVKQTFGVYERIRITIEEYHDLIRKALPAEAYKQCKKQNIRFHLKAFLPEIQLHFSLKERLKLLNLFIRNFTGDPYLWLFLGPRFFYPGFLVKLIWRLKAGKNR